MKLNWVNWFFIWGMGYWGIIIGWGGGGGGGIIIGGYGDRVEGIYCLNVFVCGIGNIVWDIGFEDINLGIICLYVGWSGNL